jgi:hypothetical protein
MGFFLWGHIKALIYMLPVDSEEDLIAPIVDAAATWQFWAHMSVSAVLSADIEVGGHMFKHLP